MAKLKRAEVSVESVRVLQVGVAEGLAAARKAESVLRKVHKSLAGIVTRSR